MRPRPAPARGKNRPRRNRRKPNALLLARNVLVLGVMAQLVVGALWSPRLAVERVEVHGARLLGEAEVARLSGVEAGVNTFQIRLGRLRRELEKEPQVRSASVSRRLPDTLVIRVEERQPFLALKRGETVWVVDETGLVYRRTTALPAEARLVRLEGGFEPKTGEPVPEPWLGALTKALQLAEAQRLRIAGMAIDAQAELWLHVTTPAASGERERQLPVRLGRPDDLPAKFADIRLWLPAVAADGEYLNVMSAGRAAYVRLGHSGPSPVPFP